MINTENFQRQINNKHVKEEILSNLNKDLKRKLISDLISKINKDTFKKSDFNKLSTEENIEIKKVRLKN